MELELKLVNFFTHARITNALFSLQQWICGKQLDLKIMNILLSPEISVVM